MNHIRKRLTLVGLLALALGVVAGPTGVAHAAKVSKSEGPVLVPDATTVGAVEVAGEGTLTFNLKGKKVKGKQVLDVNLTLNAQGGAPGALGDLFLKLVRPKSGITVVPAPGATSWVDLKFDDQSDLFPCNPLGFNASDCNYLQGGTTWTGSLNGTFNPVFKGNGGSGNWKLLILDTVPSGGEPPSSVSAKLEVKTGKKFVKE